jgi:hypothetical protein
MDSGFFIPEQGNVRETAVTTVTQEGFRRWRASLLTGEQRLKHRIRLYSQGDLLT